MQIKTYTRPGEGEIFTSALLTFFFFFDLLNYVHTMLAILNLF